MSGTADWRPARGSCALRHRRQNIAARFGGHGGTMRRLGVAVATALMLSACSTSDLMSTASMARPDDPSPTSTTTSAVVAVAYPRFDDNDPHSWKSAKPWDYAVHGTDVSKYQTSVGWSDAKAAGISFAFLKATEGGDRVDDNFAQNWRMARAAGVPRGAYHFF